MSFIDPPWLQLPKREKPDRARRPVFGFQALGNETTISTAAMASSGDVGDLGAPSFTIANGRAIEASSPTT